MAEYGRARRLLLQSAPPSRTSNTCSQMRIAGRARRNRALKQHISDGRACFARLTAPYPQQLSHDALLSSSLSTA